MKFGIVKFPGSNSDEDAFHAVTDVLGQEAEFVDLVDNGTSTTVQVDADGAANGSEYESVAVLNGVTGTTLDALVSAGQIDLWLS